MKEIWKDIEGHEGEYQVSNLGRVKSCERIIVLDRKKGVGGFKRLHPERILKQNKVGRGRQVYIGTKRFGKAKGYSVSRLVASVFCEKHEGCDVVNHIDNDQSNNVANNLEWVTYSENTKHAVKIGALPSGAKHYKTKFTEDDVRKIRMLYDEGHMTMAELRHAYCVSTGCIQGIVTRMTWRHI